MRKLRFEYLNSNITITATILEDEYPQYANDIWETFATPQRCYTHHTLSTGDFYSIRPVPPYHYVHSGNQSNPLGHDIPALCDMIPGEICWVGWQFAVPYGPSTEPLVGTGPVMVKVDPECLEDFKRASKECWNATYLHHVPADVIISRA